jgi:hypothetical protein
VIYEFNLQATGISDGKLFASILRDADNAVIGGISGWTWSKTCLIGPICPSTIAKARNTETRLVEAVEAEAINRGCGQIVIRTQTFKPRSFSPSLAFAVIARIPDYPVGHQEIKF